MPEKANASFFLSNPDCQYFPCHDMGAGCGPYEEHGPDKARFNCLFCYCPLYHYEDCPGNPQSVAVNGRLIRDCSRCDFPHRPENYEKLLMHLAAALFGNDAKAAERRR
jgi:Zn-finger protein